jgi:hypothetical protein
LAYLPAAVAANRSNLERVVQENAVIAMQSPQMPPGGLISV